MAQTIAVSIPLIAIVVLGVPSVQVGLLTAAQYAPVLVITPLLATRIDSVRRVPIMVFAHWARAAVYLAMALVSLGGFLTMPILVVMVLLAGSFTSAFDVATQAFVPNLVPRDRLVAANTRIQGSLSVAQVVGPSAGGFLVWSGRPWAAFAVFGVAFALSGAILVRARAQDTPSPVSGASFGRRFIEGYHAVFSHRILRSLLINAAWFNCFEQVMLTVFLVYSVRFAGMSEATVGMILGIGAGGAVIGAVAAGRLRTMRPRTALLVFSGMAALAPVGLVLVGPGKAWSTPIAIGVFVLYGVGVVAYNVHAVSLRQASTRSEQLGKVGATYRMFAYGAIGAGGVVGSALIGLFGLRHALVAAVIILAVGWAVMSSVLARAIGDREGEI
jgi:Na+/melibiose symporter-like transporter